MMQTNAPSAVPVLGTLLPPDDIPRMDLLTDYELGGVALNNPSLGMENRIWKAWATQAGVFLSPETAPNLITRILDVPGVSEISLAFDRNMQPSLAYVKSKTAYLKWYDTAIQNFTVTPLPGAISPRLTLDDKRFFTAATSDVLLFYLKATGDLSFRMQRDRYTIEYPFGNFPKAKQILRAGMNTVGRVQVDVA